MSKKIYFYLLFFYSIFTFAQNSASGKIVDGKTGKEITGVDIFINNSKTKNTTTASGDFKVESDTIIYQLQFVKKGFANSIQSISAENANNLSIELSGKKTNNIQEVVLKHKVVKYKNKKENPA
jgi:hypothetical protein